MATKKQFFEDEIKYPFQFAGCTVYKDKTVCNKCGQDVGEGIIAMSTHWNKCTDGNRTLNALMQAREEKGDTLTIDDIDKILP